MIRILQTDSCLSSCSSTLLLEGKKAWKTPPSSISSTVLISTMSQRDYIKFLREWKMKYDYCMIQIEPYTSPDILDH